MIRKPVFLANRVAFFSIFIAGVLITTGLGTARAEAQVSGQLVYVPVYSHIYTGDKGTPFLLAVTLSIRNTDPREGLQIERVDYYNSKGQLLVKYLEQPQVLEKLAAVRFLVKESDEAGGSGASFLVKWKSGRPISPPIIESVMIGTRNQQGISFVSRGQVVPEER